MTPRDEQDRQRRGRAEDVLSDRRPMKPPARPEPDHAERDAALRKAIEKIEP